MLAFPCNQFGAQEPGTDDEVSEFARSKFDVNFPMFSKVEVNGDGACALYQMLKIGDQKLSGSSRTMRSKMFNAHFMDTHPLVFTRCHFFDKNQISKLAVFHVKPVFLTYQCNIHNKWMAIFTSILYCEFMHSLLKSLFYIISGWSFHIYPLPLIHAFTIKESILHTIRQNRKNDPFFG